MAATVAGSINTRGNSGGNRHHFILVVGTAVTLGDFLFGDIFGQ